jgi:pilT protein domain protein
MILVDTNILLDILEDDPVWYEWSLQQLQAQSLIHDLAVNPIIYSELSLAFHTVEEQDRALQSMDLKYQELPRPALFLAGLAFVQYRRSGGQKNNVLPDFFIGAHAAVQGWSILTRDPRRYRNYFPSVRLITPEAPPPKAPIG